MRIAAVECIRLTYRYKPEEVWGWPGGTYRGWTAGFVRVTDAEGRYGIGEIGDGLPAHNIVPAAVDRMAPILIGQDPRHIRLLKDRMYRSAPGWGRRGLGISVISGIETALFDLVGKALGVPAHVLLGGALHIRMPVYASGGVDPTVEQLKAELRAYADLGFRAVKVRIGYGLRKDLELASAAREAIGPDVRLLLDLGGSYLPQRQQVMDVMRLVRELEPLHPFWLEEPLHPDDIPGHRRLRELTTIPIAGGENTRTAHEVRQLLDGSAVDVLQTDAVYAGGMLEQLEIAALAAQHGVAMAPHTWGSAPGLMANIHAAACMPNLLMAEYSQPYNALRDRILLQPVQVEDGELVLPDLPGLGVDIPDDLLKEHPYDPNGGAVLRIEE